MYKFLILTITGVCLLTSPLRADELADKATEILKRACHECHGIRDYGAGLDVLDPVSLFKDRGENTRPFLAKSNLDRSLIWERIESDLMPPEDNEFNIPLLTAAEKATVREWIEAGADFPENNRVFKRPFVSRQDIVDIIEKDLRRQRQSLDVRNIRYFNLANLHNNGTIPPETLQHARAALSKAMNSLSNERQIVPPRIVDADTNQVVLAINLVDYGWTEQKWNYLLQHYPYSLVPEDPEEYTVYQAISKFWGGIEQETSLRADWFIATATRGDHYHFLLDLPKTLDELAAANDVDVRKNFLTHNLLRGAVLASGVSSQNRLMDRHESRFGCFWLSYDFAASAPKGNISVFPLGPNFSGHPFERSAFEESGSEVVYSLANGLHGYLIVDDKGDRITVAPVEIVVDQVAVDGVPSVVNGLSCMGCHTVGIRDFTDKLVEFSYVEGPTGKRHLANLMGATGELDRVKLQDRNQYLQALIKAVGPYYPDQQLTLESIRKLPEPISLTARNYHKDLDMITAAAELGIEDPETLSDLGRTLLRKGLAPFMTEDGIIKRHTWQGILYNYTIFQETAEELVIGLPVIP